MWQSLVKIAISGNVVHAVFMEQKFVRYNVQRQTLPHVYCLLFWNVSLCEDTRNWQHGIAQATAADRR